MSVAQVGLNYEKKTDGRKSHWTVPLSVIDYVYYVHTYYFDTYEYVGIPASLHKYLSILCVIDLASYTSIFCQVLAASPLFYTEIHLYAIVLTHFYQYFGNYKIYYSKLLASLNVLTSFTSVFWHLLRQCSCIFLVIVLASFTSVFGHLLQQSSGIFKCSGIFYVSFLASFTSVFCHLLRQCSDIFYVSILASFTAVFWHF